MSKKKIGYFLTGVASVSLFVEKLPLFPSAFYQNNEIESEEELVSFLSLYRKGMYSCSVLMITLLLSIFMTAMFLPKDSVYMDVLLFVFLTIEIARFYLSSKYNVIVKNDKKMIY